jgi:Flp pilus assembly protein TadB
MGSGQSQAEVAQTKAADEEWMARCSGCKQVPDNGYHRAALAAMALLAIVIAILVWFVDIVYQVTNFVLAIVIIALAAFSFLMPVKCKRCTCA